MVHVLIWHFFSEKRYIRKSAMTARWAETGLTFFLWHQLVYTTHFLNRCSSWFRDKLGNILRKRFIYNWLLVNSKVWSARVGRFWCGNFAFACVSKFGKHGSWIGADTSSCNTSWEQKRLRTKEIEAKEKQLELFCTETDVFWLEYL